ncbi:MAG: DNA translocase FtsK 4TM domain-containing protein [Nitrospirae bacterium]|nr:DNA translocase FtsK 4TM domain-containing protein [Nitrospirota bacterium]
MAKGVKRIKEEVLGVTSILGSLYLGLSLFSYSKWDPSFFTYTKDPVRNYGGVAGAFLADMIITIAGISAFAIPVLLFIYGLRRMLGKERARIHLIGTVLFIFSSSMLASLITASFNIQMETGSGGLVGFSVTAFLERYFSLLGAYLVSLSFFLTSIILLSPVSLSSIALQRKAGGSEQDVRQPQPAPIEEEILIREPEPEPVKPEPEQNRPLQIRTGPDPAPARPKPVHKPVPVTKDGYTLPSVELLLSYEPPSGRYSDEDMETNKALLKGKLSDFDVEGDVVNFKQGPIVTMYEFAPAPGVKINRVVSLADDLALALKAQSVRISPIAGKNTIGIEVPNQVRETVSLREIVSSDRFQKSNSLLTLALGKDIYGDTVVANLATMPHLLVAGSTGAGKSVSMNSMVMSILYKASPKEVKMLMIDPKLLELSTYEDIPHLISPVITNPKKAAEALRKMVFEMERRYRLLAEKGARNIDNFNKQASAEDRLPYIIIFIDELADLMFASSNEVEDSIARLAQMARAAGIHLIIATQRPSVDVITGLIKANFPARISFQVFSKIDSRTILDTQGAEQLLGKGDMLVMLPGAKLVRVHGALVTEEETTSVTEYIKSQGTPDFSIFEEIPVEEPREAEDTAEKDEMYDKALEFAESVGEISISSLQRRFKIGYNRAARIMEIMEDDGLVGPPKGAGKPRDFFRRRN